MGVASVSDSIEQALGPLGLGENAHPFAEMAAFCPVGAFDSGMGGLSVINDMRSLLPYEDIVYYGDNANCPYGARPDEWLRERSAQIAAFLMERGSKAVVVACNTASAAGLHHLRAIYPMPIIGLVPALKPAVETTRTGIVGVIATPFAINGRLLTEVIERFAAPAGVQVIKVAPEGWVEAVERGDLDTPATEQAVERDLSPILNSGADTIVLGCTHYPFLKPLIRKVVGDQVDIIDSGLGVSRQTANVLRSGDLLRPGASRGKLTVYTSANPDAVRSLVHRLVGEQVEVLQC
jgi:glutamate racemase